MATTLQILESVVVRLQARLPQLAVEYFPERPAEYRVNHAVGALLVSYPGSNFAETVDVGCIAQPRTLKLSITVMLRQLNGRGGAVDVLDVVRAALIGFRPPDCRKTKAVSEKFLGQVGGIWQYAVDFSTEAMQVEDVEPDNLPVLTTVTYEETP
ncbi:Gp37 family protein [Jeongeupia wiesaeckerbachi]|uniref:Gp37 family protein n=1 Tax=Jeongeupia wiesaeckerbachi TaxID=3051218 RepID=UPI003D807787